MNEVEAKGRRKGLVRDGAVMALICGAVLFVTGQSAGAQADYSVVNTEIGDAWEAWSVAAMVTIGVAIAIGFSFWGIPVLIRNAKRIFRSAGG